MYLYLLVEAVWQRCTQATSMADTFDHLCYVPVRIGMSAYSNRAGYSIVTKGSCELKAQTRPIVHL